MKKVVAEAYRDIDFSRATRGPVIKIDPGKTKISIRLDNAVLEHFKNEVERAGTGNYQTLINDAVSKGAKVVAGGRSEGTLMSATVIAAMSRASA